MPFLRSAARRYSLMDAGVARGLLWRRGHVSACARAAPRIAERVAGRRTTDEPSRLPRTRASRGPPPAGSCEPPGTWPPSRWRLHARGGVSALRSGELRARGRLQQRGVRVAHWKGGAREADDLGAGSGCYVSGSPDPGTDGRQEQGGDCGVEAAFKLARNAAIECRDAAFARSQCGAPTPNTGTGRRSQASSHHLLLSLAAHTPHVRSGGPQRLAAAPRTAPRTRW